MLTNAARVRVRRFEPAPTPFDYVVARFGAVCANMPATSGPSGSSLKRPTFFIMASTASLFTAWWLLAVRFRVPGGFEAGASIPGVEVGGLRFQRWGLGIPALLFVGLVLLQLVPLPPSPRRRR